MNRKAALNFEESLKVIYERLRGLRLPNGLSLWAFKISNSFLGTAFAQTEENNSNIEIYDEMCILTCFFRRWVNNRIEALLGSEDHLALHLFTLVSSSFVRVAA